MAARAATCRLTFVRVLNPYTGYVELEITRERVVEPDPCLVDAAPLASSLKEFVTDWYRTRPSTKGRFRSAETAGDVEPLSPYESLSADTGISEHTLRRVVSYADTGRRGRVEMRVADALVAAGIGDEWLLRELQPEHFSHNPRASRPCESCGGSG